MNLFFVVSFAGVFYVMLCALLLFSNMPLGSVDPMDPLSQGPSLIKGRGPKEAEQDVEGEGLNRMMSLVRSPMFSEQGDKLKWIKERILRSVCEASCMCVCVCTCVRPLSL